MGRQISPSLPRSFLFPFPSTVSLLPVVSPGRRRSFVPTEVDRRTSNTTNMRSARNDSPGEFSSDLCQFVVRCPIVLPTSDIEYIEHSHRATDYNEKKEEVQCVTMARPSSFSHQFLRWIRIFLFKFDHFSHFGSAKFFEFVLGLDQLSFQLKRKEEKGRILLLLRKLSELRSSSP